MYYFKLIYFNYLITDKLTSLFASYYMTKLNAKVCDV